jgi:WD40 repeat protein
MVQELLSIDTGDAICHCLTFDKDTKTIAVGCSDALIKMINIEKGEITSQLKGHDDSVNSLYINQNNTAMYSCGNDGKINIWK